MREHLYVKGPILPFLLESRLLALVRLEFGPERVDGLKGLLNGVDLPREGGDLSLVDSLSRPEAPPERH